ncbi:hypothetical protein OSB04_014269 [Centaurea solstitialis]|uniref:Uncharacterized protein n=1 Tax=Centaurea solstitialis TaxID=347529 RepID=A0AA38SYD8_9ASTR|nr:hypothetical protein OSB04_014269 [Centaurea solstitialis]
MCIRLRLGPMDVIEYAAEFMKLARFKQTVNTKDIKAQRLYLCIDSAGVCIDCQDLRWEERVFSWEGKVWEEKKERKARLSA